MPTTYADNSVGKTGLAIPDRYSDEIWTPWSDNALLINRLLGGFIAIPQGDANYTLLDTSAARESRTLALKFTATLTAAREIKIDTTTSGKYSGLFFILWNASAGAFKLTIKTTAGGSTGPDINQGKIRAVFHDGTNVYPLGPEIDATTFAIAGSSFGTQTANQVFAGPTSGGAASPAFRALVAGDLPATIWARVYHNAAQSIANNTPTVLAFNSERGDTDTIHDTATNNSRLTCKTAGKYIITAHVEYEAAAGGLRWAILRLNGSTGLGMVSMGLRSDNYWAGAITTIYDLAVNDYVEVLVLQDSGGSVNVASLANRSPEFAMARLGS